MVVYPGWYRREAYPGWYTRPTTMYGMVGRAGSLCASLPVPPPYESYSGWWASSLCASRPLPTTISTMVVGGGPVLKRRGYRPAHHINVVVGGRAR